MKTIPDLIDDIKHTITIKWKRIIDIPYSWIEHVGSKMSVFAWQRRWGNRQKGTGYVKKEDEKK